MNTTTDYFLTDALGSVRQLTNGTGAITYANAYDPYGVVTATSGASGTPYGYTGEYTSNDLVYLRARHYDPAMGRFLTRDTWGGDMNSPMSFNAWNYGYGNPVKYTDSTGMLPCVVDHSSDEWTGLGWTDGDIKKRVDTAEKYVPYIFGDTYVGAGTYVAAG